MANVRLHVGAASRRALPESGCDEQPPCVRRRCRLPCFGCVANGIPVCGPTWRRPLPSRTPLPDLDLSEWPPEPWSVQPTEPVLCSLGAVFVAASPGEMACVKFPSAMKPNHRRAALSCSHALAGMSASTGLKDLRCFSGAIAAHWPAHRRSRHRWRHLQATTGPRAGAGPLTTHRIRAVWSPPPRPG